MNHTTQILNLYYIQHKKIIEIQKILNISSPYISKIIKKDYRYENEKNNRKKLSIEKRKKNQRNFIKNKREIQKYCDNYLLVQAQHIQASKELSKKSHLTNENYRKWNYSAYNYNPSKKRYEFDDKLGRSFDVPKYIKER